MRPLTPIECSHLLRAAAQATGRLRGGRWYVPRGGGVRVCRRLVDLGLLTCAQTEASHKGRAGGRDGYQPTALGQEMAADLRAAVFGAP